MSGLLAALAPQLTVAGWVLLWLAGRHAGRRWRWCRAEARRQAVRYAALDERWELWLAEVRARRAGGAVRA